jgi:hypothetical protein
MRLPMLKTSRAQNILRTASLAILLMAAVGSVAFVLWAGRNNNSIFLRLLFGLWVFSPFLALLMSHIISKKWAAPVQKTTYILTIGISACALFCYGCIGNPAGMKPAFKFLIVPLISWIAIAIIIPTSTSRYRKTREKEHRM